MPNTINMRTSSATLTQSEGVWVATFYGVITPADIHAFHLGVRQRASFANFFLSDWRNSVCCFTSEMLHDPTNVDYSGDYEPMPWRFGAMLGRPDQMPLLLDLQSYQSAVLGNVRRAFSDQVECWKWSEKISNFLTVEDADGRQGRLFI